MKSIILSPSALLNMMVSAAEAYKQEALGVIVGKRRKNAFVIEHAVPYQTTKRGYAFVAQSNKCVHLDVFLDSFQSIVGDFHTHTDYKRKKVPTHMSVEDKEDLKLEKIGLVVGVKRNIKYAHEPRVNLRADGKGVAFTIKNYRYVIRCYYKKRSGKILELNVKCKDLDSLLPKTS